MCVFAETGSPPLWYITVEKYTRNNLIIIPNIPFGPVSFSPIKTQRSKKITDYRRSGKKKTKEKKKKKKKKD